MKNFLLKINRALVAKKKILSLFLALLTVSVMNAKVAFLVPAGDTSRESMRYEDVDGAEQSPERRAYDWFNTNFVTPGNGQFICFNDLSSIPTDINAIWIYVDRVGFDAGQFDALFASHISELQAFVNAGGNLFLCKQATRLEKDLVGAKKSDNTVLEPTYNCGGYITDYNREEKWGMSVHFYDGDGWGSYLSHAMFVPIPNDHKGNDRHIEMIWSEPLEHVVTNNNCLFEHSHMEMNGTGDATNLANFQTRNNCKVLGCWSNGGGCYCGGLIEFYPTETRKGTVIMMGLAAYQWINNNNGWGIENIQYMTKGALDYLNATPDLAWNTETVPESGVINTQHSMTAHANAGFNITYAAADPVIANIGSGDGNIYFNYFGNATFTATATGDGWTAPKSATATIHSATIPVNGGDQNVKFAYVLPYSMHTMSNYDNEEGFRPDFEAANWFYHQFIVGEVGGQHGCFVRPSDLGSLDPAIKVLWIHNDHVGKESADYYNDLGGNTFRDNLKTFVANGGNVFLSKQATRLIGDLGRNDYPAYEANGYGDNNNWRIGNHWDLNGTDIDHSTHAVYAGLNKDFGGSTTIMGDGRHTNNNDIWNSGMLGWSENKDPQKLYDYETYHNCRILGAWGHYNGNGAVSDMLECVGFAEFYPQDNVAYPGGDTYNQTGTIITMGLAAYHWANPTDHIKILTRDLLYYLNIDETPGFVWDVTPVDGSVGSEQIVHVEHKESEIHWTSSDENIVKIEDDPAHPDDPEYKKLVLKAAGKATITATRSGDGYKIPKNVKSPTFVTKTITVANGYTRDGLMQDYYYTVCLPKGAASYNGAQMFRIADKTENNDIVIEEVGTMEAGIPYIFLATGEQLNVIYNDGVISEAQSANGLIGYIGSGSKTLNPDGDKLYILAENQIWKVDQDVTVPSNRAYIDMSAINPTTPMPGRKRFVISSQNTATGIDGLNVSDSPKANKIIRNGQLLIKQGERIYNAQGQIVK